ncbi:MAG TPA: ThiF family adenylyltransferase [Roseiflexaceae bacterium]|nr:ThiF family adenylyltransferase [Roseiflexaceae bacterium]
MHSIQTDNRFYPHLREQFRRDLQAAGLHQVDVESQTEQWSGSLQVNWRDPITDASCVAQHAILIELPAAFPFASPRVFPTDTDPPIRDARHQMPGANTGRLCLWPNDSAGWMPFLTAEDVLERIRTWFVHYHQDDWPAEERPPDLHMYFPSEGRHPLMLISDDWQPPTEAMTGRFGIWQRLSEYAFAGLPTEGVQMPPHTHTDRLLSTLGLSKQHRDRVGLWFRLQREPRPCTTLLGLLAEIDAAAGTPPGWTQEQLRGLFGDKIRKRPQQANIALGYPGEAAHETWLFLEAQLGIREGICRWGTTSALQNTPIRSYETAPVDTASLMRRTGHVARRINQRRVVVFGQGAIGGTITLLLAKAGIPHLRVVDDDVLRPGNAVRHVGGLGFAGQEKTRVVQWHVQLHAPDCTVLTEAASWNPETLTGWIAEADLVIDATANPTFSLLLNQLCIEVGRPAIYASAHRRAALGRIRVVRPGRDACLICYEAGYRETGTYPVLPLGDEGAFVETGCGVPTVEASAADIDAVAAAAAQTALRLLRDTLGSDNHCLLVNEVLPDVTGIFRRRGANWQTWRAIDGCESCGPPQSVR